MTGFMPRKPRFLSGVKRHVSESIKLNPGKPRLVGGELHKMIFQFERCKVISYKKSQALFKGQLNFLNHEADS